MKRPLPLLCTFRTCGAGAGMSVHGVKRTLSLLAPTSENDPEPDVRRCF